MAFGLGRLAFDPMGCLEFEGMPRLRWTCRAAPASLTIGGFLLMAAPPLAPIICDGLAGPLNPLEPLLAAGPLFSSLLLLVITPLDAPAFTYDFGIGAIPSGFAGRLALLTGYLEFMTGCPYLILFFTYAGLLT